jgi:hypothetical protein
MTFKVDKWFFVLVGVIFALAGFASYNADLQKFVIGSLLLVSSFVMFGAVAWRKLIDGKVEVDKDVPSIIGLILAVINLTGGLLFYFDVAIPEWMKVPIAISMAATGLLVVLIGFQRK